MSPAFAALQRFYAAEETYMAAATPDFGPVAATLHPQCLIRQPAALPYGGDWHGRDRFASWMEAFRATWSSLTVNEPGVYTTDDDRIVFSRSHVHAVACATGRRTDWRLLQQVEVHDGLILTLEPFHWNTAAIVAALG